MRLAGSVRIYFMAVKQLTHNSQVRVKGFEFRNKITVGTVGGYAEQYGNSPTRALQRAKASGHEIAWTNREASVLSADYAGKSEDMDRADEAFLASPEIEDGEIVQIDGDKYRVKVMGERFSDPVKFIPA